MSFHCNIQRRNQLLQQVHNSYGQHIFEDVLPISISYQWIKKPYLSHNDKGEETKEWLQWKNLNTNKKDIPISIIRGTPQLESYINQFTTLTYDKYHRATFMGRTFYETNYLNYIKQILIALDNPMKIEGRTKTQRYIWSYPYGQLPKDKHFNVRACLEPNNKNNKLVVIDLHAFEMTIFCTLAHIEPINFNFLAYELYNNRNERDKAKKAFYTYLYSLGTIADNPTIMYRHVGKYIQQITYQQKEQQLYNPYTQTWYHIGKNWLHTYIQSTASFVFDKIIDYLRTDNINILFHLHDEIVIETKKENNLIHYFRKLLDKIDITHLYFSYAEGDNYGNLKNL